MKLKSNMPPLLIQMVPIVNMTAEQFYEFCQLNQELRIERTARGDLIIMSPAAASSWAGSLIARIRTFISTAQSMK